MSNIDRMKVIIDTLRKAGLRITSQRRLLISIILQNECSSTKEIYYEAIKKDPNVGIATVYRMIKTLEDYELINRKNIYDISYENLKLSRANQIVFVKNNKQQVIALDKEEWYQQMEKRLRELGVSDRNSSFTVIIKEHEQNSLKNKKVGIIQ